MRGTLGDNVNIHGHSKIPEVILQYGSSGFMLTARVTWSPRPCGRIIVQFHQKRVSLVHSHAQVKPKIGVKISLSRQKRGAP